MIHSYSIKYAKEVFVLVTTRGSFARNQGGESWTRSIDDAYTLHNEKDAMKAAKQLNDRLGKAEVHPEPIFEHMKLAWGFDYDKTATTRICVQKYFAKETEVISVSPHSDPEAQKYSYPQDKAFSDPKIAWEHLKAKRLHDLEYARQSLEEINDDLAACEKSLNPNVEEHKNVVSIKRDPGEE